MLTKLNLIYINNTHEQCQDDRSTQSRYMQCTACPQRLQSLLAIFRLLIIRLINVEGLFVLNVKSKYLDPNRLFFMNTKIPTERTRKIIRGA